MVTLMHKSPEEKSIQLRSDLGILHGEEDFSVDIYKSREKKGQQMAKTKGKLPEEMAYEEAFRELKDLVEKLESQDLQLEEGLKLFERGQALAKRCGQLLEEAEIKIKQITVAESGEVEETEFELEQE